MAGFSGERGVLEALASEKLGAVADSVEAGVVERAGESEFRVRDYGVRLDTDPPRCTCMWWTRHAGDRGPCKHVLAAHLCLES